MRSSPEDHGAAAADDSFLGLLFLLSLLSSLLFIPYIVPDYDNSPGAGHHVLMELSVMCFNNNGDKKRDNIVWNKEWLDQSMPHSNWFRLLFSFIFYLMFYTGIFYLYRFNHRAKYQFMIWFTVALNPPLPLLLSGVIRKSRRLKKRLMSDKHYKT